MLIPSVALAYIWLSTSLSRRVNANSQRIIIHLRVALKLIKKGEC